MSERDRFSEEEIAAIFEQAAQAQQRAQDGHSGQGLSLKELTQVGEAAGIDARYVSAAAATVRESGPTPRRIVSLGQQVNVGKTTVLLGPFEESDWNDLVVDLRNTFDASGTVSIVGPVREWRNGNLRISVEPSGHGSVLRMSSRNSNLQGRLVAGATMMAASFSFLLAQLFSMPDRAFGPILMLWSLFAAAGIALSASASLQLPRWRQTREDQMDDVALRATERALTRTARGDAHLPTQTSAIPLLVIEDDFSDAASTEDSVSQAPAESRRMRT